MPLRSTVPLKRVPFARHPKERSARHVNPFKEYRDPKDDSSYWISKCDRLVSRYFRRLGSCELANFSGAPFPCLGNLEHHHIVSRKYHSVRHSLSNGLCVCHAHHVWLEVNKPVLRKWLEHYHAFDLQELESKKNLPNGASFKERYAELVSEIGPLA